MSIKLSPSEDAPAEPSGATPVTSSEGNPQPVSGGAGVPRRKLSVWARVKRDRTLLIMVAPALFLVLLFSYVPMAGNIVAWKEYSPYVGIIDSPWVAWQNFARIFGRSLTWEDIDWLRGVTKLPLLVKGICHPDDARKAIDHGADGIYCSNHGGRQANGGIPAIDCLADVVDAAGDAPVVFDSGVRGGPDVVKALAIGAAQCLALLWPGFSRSASSILGGMLLGLDRPTATKFSFYLGVPTLGGAALLDFIKSREILAQIGVVNVAIGAVTSFVVAYFAIGWLLRFVSTNNFKGFAVYRVVVGVLILVLIARGVLQNGSLA